MRYATPDRIECVVFDWAGTIVDFGSFAPTQVFVEAFAQFGVNITLDEARGPMGRGKWDHIRALCDEPSIAERFRARYGHLPEDADVTRIYEHFMPLQIEKVASYSDLIPGALDTVAQLRANGVRIGSCSGYPRAVMEKVIETARAQGLTVDHVVSTDEVPNGRPFPAQSLANAIALGVADVAACVKVDDTAPGILEGRAAGMWTVALLLSGNALGLTAAQHAVMTDQEKRAARERIGQQLRDTRAHYMIDTVADLPGVIADIERRLQAGERPQTAA